MLSMLINEAVLLISLQHSEVRQNCTECVRGVAQGLGDWGVERLLKPGSPPESRSKSETRRGPVPVGTEVLVSIPSRRKGMRRPS